MSMILEYFHELKKEKLRMTLTVLGVCWGMANIVLMLSVGEGLHRELQRGLLSMGKDIVVVWSGQTSKAYAGFPVGRRIRFTGEDLDRITERVPLIDKISPEFIKWSVTIKDNGNNLDTQVSGVYPCWGEMRSMVPEAGGRFINDMDLARKRRVIFIGNAVRDKFFGEGSNPVGRQITVMDIPFTVIGVMKKKMQTSSYSGMDKDRCSIPASTYKTMFNQNYPNNAVFRPADRSRSEEAQDAFRKFLASRYKCDPEDESIANFWDTIESVEIQGKILRGIQIFMGIIGGLTLIIAGIGVANIMYVTVKERTREIGIKMAVGARPVYIISQFVLEALLTVGIGGALGIALGKGMIFVTWNLPIEHEVMNFIGRPVFSALLALISSVILTFIGLLTGVFPARKASLVDPVEALRYE
ncbi:MAG: FtsX-like permease family protein [Candidatus Glassbacteria bacterium]|nr:FtsX-like permease family protein [Candidatus Glassbacteria bacterium]